MSAHASKGTYLDTIVADVRRRLDANRAAIPFAPAETTAALPTRHTCSARIDAARAQGRLAVIAEVKRRSPSKGEIDTGLDPATLASAYVDGGADAISVLTEPDHFGGDLADLDAVRAALPETVLLRKDFMVAPSQFVETLAHGADLVLIIAALFPDGEELSQYVDFATQCGFEVLLEVHNEVELERALCTDARLIGINNRDLRSFEVDLAVTERLATRIPDDRIVVSESGIATPDDAARVRAAGADAILVGEALVRAPDPARLVHDLAEAGR